MMRWKKVLAFGMAAIFFIGIIQDTGSINAAEEGTEQEDIASDIKNVTETSETITPETETSDGERKDKKKQDENPNIQKKVITRKKAGSDAKKKKLVNGQTLLDVSKGDIVIKVTGAAGGGLEEDETELNPEGYRITGTTEDHNVTVERGVTTGITLDNVDITCGKQPMDTPNRKLDCINVSHANVTILLIGTNRLTSYAGNPADVFDGYEGNALAKDGMDGELTIKCQKAGQEGHKCDDDCGSLYAGGNRDLYHAGAIGSTRRNAGNSSEAGFVNFTIEGGNIESVGGKHSPGLGGACCTTLLG